MREINQAGIDIIKEHEGCELNAYRCPAGVLTIGYGSTRDVHEGMTITQQEADERLFIDLHDAEEAVDREISAVLTDNQFSALVSFTFNVGAHALHDSTLRRKLNAGDYACVPTELNKWRKGGGKVLSGLVARRKAEGELFTRA